MIETNQIDLHKLKQIWINYSYSDEIENTFRVFIQLERLGEETPYWPVRIDKPEANIPKTFSS